MIEQHLTDAARPPAAHVDAGDAHDHGLPSALLADGPQGRTGPASYRLPGSPRTEIVTLAFLVSVRGFMYAGGAGRTTVRCLPLFAAALVAGWYAVRRRINSASTTADT